MFRPESKFPIAWVPIEMTDSKNNGKFYHKCIRLFENRNFTVCVVLNGVYFSTVLSAHAENARVRTIARFALQNQPK